MGGRQGTSILYYRYKKYLFSIILQQLHNLCKKKYLPCKLYCLQFHIYRFVTPKKLVIIKQEWTIQGNYFQIYHQRAVKVKINIVTCLTIDSEIPDAPKQGFGKQRVWPSMECVIGDWVCHAAHLKRLTYVQKTGSFRKQCGHSACVNVARTGHEDRGSDVCIVESHFCWFLLVIYAAAPTQIHNHLYLLQERVSGSASNNALLY